MTHEERLNSIISRLVGNQDPDDTRAAYRDWAESYDQDLNAFGYVAPKIGVAYFEQAHGHRDGLILDAGCGTGLCGQLLIEQGYSNLHGADFSPDMLVKARVSGSYHSLFETDFHQPLNFADDTYDGALSIGVYSSFIGVGFVRELIRVTKPRGVICMSCRLNFFESDLLPNLRQLESAKQISLESTEIQPYMTGQDAEAAYVVLRVS